MRGVTEGSENYAPPGAAIRPEPLPPSLRPRVQVILALLAAAVLARVQLNPALLSAGPYSSLVVVSLSVFGGLLAAHMLALGPVVFAISRPLSHLPRAARYAAISLAVAFGSVLVHLSPLVPYFALVGICKVQALCPMEANPIALSFSGLLRHGPIFPTFCTLVALAIVVRAIRTRRPFIENEA